MSRKLIALSVLAVWAGAEAHAQSDVEVVHAEPIEVLDAPVGVGAAKPASGASTRFEFIALGRSFDLELKPNDGLEKLRSSMSPTPEAVAYRGTIAGNPESWVRLVFSAAGPAGLIWDGTQLYGIERPGDSITASDRAMMFRLDDVYIAPGALSCAAGGPEPVTGSAALATLSREFAVAAAQGATLNLNIGAVADSEFVGLYGADAETALLTRFNNVDGIYSEQLGVQISVAQVDILTGPDDPFTTTNSGDLLDELALYRASNGAQDAQGLTHLFTGKNLDGTTVGIAYIGALCATKSRFDDRSFGAGLSEGRRGSVTDSLIAAHEIGHNFGAPHDAEANSACESTPATFLMAPMINGSDQFSQCSIEQMQPEILSASCLTAIPQADVSLSSNTPNPTVGAGEAFDYSVAVRNLGTDIASNVALHAQLGAGAVLTDATLDSGSCSFVGGIADCSTASIPAGAVETLHLTFTAALPGSYGLTVDSAADVDAVAGNNAIVDSITVVPIVDLSIAGSGTNLEPGASTKLTFSLTNASGYEATDLAVSLTLDAGLRADAVTLESGDCALDTTPIVCRAPRLAARDMLAIVVDLTAVAAGSPQITLAATAAEADANTADNELTRVISVVSRTQAGAGAASGGGGSAGLAWLALLPLLAIAPARRRRGPLRRD